MKSTLRALAIIPALALLLLAGIFLSAGTSVIFDFAGGGPYGPEGEGDFSIMPLLIMGLIGYAMVAVSEKLSPPGWDRWLPVGIALAVVILFSYSVYVGLSNGQGFLWILDDIAIAVGAIIGGFTAYTEGCSFD